VPQNTRDLKIELLDLLEEKKLRQERVSDAMGGPDKRENSFRLFMVPGMGHCFGPPEFDTISVLEEWVEKGKALDRIVATYPSTETTGSKLERTRPLCPYPQVAKYKGSGSTDDASNFVCSKE